MELFPEITPYRSGYLPAGVQGAHQIYFEECGNPSGPAILFLHGGPGGGISDKHRRYFDPHFWRIILFDQRGAGKSLPFAAIEGNTTWELVADIEKLRRYLGVAGWTLFGGSWGSTLALAYAIQHVGEVEGLVLRGIFLGRRKEMDWLYHHGGASKFFPKEWEAFRSEVALQESPSSKAVLQAYHKALFHSDEARALKAAQAWSAWEASLCRLLPDPQLIAEFTEPRMALAIARLENHYMVNQLFFARENWILEECHRLVHLPCRIIHGRYDMVCPPENAWDLHQALPGSQMVMVEGAGHVASDAPVASALLQATQDFKALRLPVGTPRRRYTVTESSPSALGAESTIREPSSQGGAPYGPP